MTLDIILVLLCLYTKTNYEIFNFKFYEINYTRFLGINNYQNDIIKMTILKIFTTILYYNIIKLEKQLVFRIEIIVDFNNYNYIVNIFVNIINCNIL